jgi:hypothetical protein
VGSLSRKRYTQYVGQQPKGHWGNSENTGGDPHGRRQGRECVCACTNGATGRQTQLDTTGGAKKHQHARCEATREQTRSTRTGDEGGASAGIQRHLAAGVINTGLSLAGRRQMQSADWVLGVRLRRTQHAARCARAVLADLKPQYNTLHCVIMAPAFGIGSASQIQYWRCCSGTGTWHHQPQGTSAPPCHLLLEARPRQRVQMSSTDC